MCGTTITNITSERSIAPWHHCPPGKLAKTGCFLIVGHVVKSILSQDFARQCRKVVDIRPLVLIQCWSPVRSGPDHSLTLVTCDSARSRAKLQAGQLRALRKIESTGLGKWNDVEKSDPTVFTSVWSFLSRLPPMKVDNFVLHARKKKGLTVAPVSEVWGSISTNKQCWRVTSADTIV